MIGHMSQPPAWTISSISYPMLLLKVAANYNALKPDSPCKYRRVPITVTAFTFRRDGDADRLGRNGNGARITRHDEAGSALVQEVHEQAREAADFHVGQLLEDLPRHLHALFEREERLLRVQRRL